MAFQAPFGRVMRPPFGPGLSTAAVAYLLRDEFTTPESSPITSPRTCEPGPGTMIATESSGSIAISSGIITLTGYAVSYNDPSLYSQSSYPVVSGLALFSTLTFASSTAAHFGLDSDQTNPHVNAIRFGIGGNRLRSNNIDMGSYVAGTYGTIIVCRSAGGAFFLVDSGSGYVLDYVLSAGAYANLYFGTGVYTVASLQIDRIAIANLGTPWNNDYGIVTQQLSGARDPGDTFTHEANCLIEFTCTTRPSSGQIEVRFRAQDTSNYWQVTIDSSGNLDLDEVVAGTPTQRGTSAGVIANGDRVVIAAVGTSINVVEADTLRITYTSATNFQTATSGELETEGTGGSVSDIVSWPYTPSAAALAELAKYVS